jgi:hypothetical protein
MVYFHTKNPNLGKSGYIFRIIFDHLEYFAAVCYGYFTAIWYNLGPFWYSLWLFGILFPFWYVWTKKIWQPWPDSKFNYRSGFGGLELLLLGQPLVVGDVVDAVGGGSWAPSGADLMKPFRPKFTNKT